MSKINFQFDDLLKLLQQLREDPEPPTLREMAQELNRLFKDSKCTEVLYTNNSDKMFFGVYVMPHISSENIYDIIIDKKVQRIDKYSIELDSKLFDYTCRLTNAEILSLIIHEISQVTLSSYPIDEAIKEIDVYLDRTQSSLRITDNINYASVLTFGFKDLIHKISSIFCNSDGNIFFNDFVSYCGFLNDINKAVYKLKSCEYISYLSQGVERSTIIAWVLKLYNNIKTLRIQTIRGFRKAIEYTPSRLVRNDMKRIMNNMSRIDDESLLESFMDELGKKFNNSFYKTINEYEGDFYDLKIQVNAVVDQDEALLLLHSINTKISILDNYIENCELDNKTLERSYRLRDNLYRLRDELSKKSLFRQNYRRIYVNYDM